ncbi:MAG: hypothetical protein MK081_08065 [Flavobacteriales bacterium]|nr:hypothetical protein [Flavobacteriales bacterium]
MTKYYWLAFSFLAILASSCYYDVESELYPVPCEVSESPTYNDQIAPLITQNCAVSGCHSSTDQGAPRIFESYEAVVQAIDEGIFQMEVITSKDMPPSGPLPPCDIELLEAWIAEGTPE